LKFMQGGINVLPCIRLKFMKNSIILVVILATACILAYQAIEHLPNYVDKPTDELPSLPHMIALGPVGKNMNYTEAIGQYSYNMKAEKLNFKKSKIMGFDSNLMKKMVAKELTFTISKGDKTILAIQKDLIELSPAMQVITIDNPTILIPATMTTPDKIKIDKTGQTITFFYGKKQKLWNLH
jgi:hypothetical protein